MTEESRDDIVAAAKAERFKNFIEARRLLEASSHKVIEQFDKAVMTLAAGGLSISLLFIKEVAPQPNPDTMWLLATGWIGFTVSLLLVLCSFLFGYHSYRLEIQVLEKMYKDPQLEIPPPNRWISAALVFNWLAAFALIFGAIFIVWFAILNPPDKEGSTNMSKAKQPRSAAVPLINTAAPIRASQVVLGPATPVSGQTAQPPAASPTNAAGRVQTPPPAQSKTNPPQSSKQ